jgi:hypothetical protein
LGFSLLGGAFILYFVPWTNFVLKGSVGFLSLATFAILIGLSEKTAQKPGRNIIRGLRSNLALLFMILWYLIGVEINTYIGANGFEDWRLMLQPVILLFALFFGFAYLQDDACYRKFQIWFILAIGLQMMYTIYLIKNDATLMREMVKSDTWAHGDQATFSLLAISFPIILTRAFLEKKKMQIALFASSFLILVAIAISTFATPVGLLIFSIACAISLILFARYNKKRILRYVSIGMLLFFITAPMYSLYKGTSYFVGVQDKIVTLFNDPTSGGYKGGDVDESRYFAAQLSWNSFSENPFFGASGGNIRTNSNVGQHSSAIDALGAYGLLGGGGALWCIILMMAFTSFQRFLKYRSLENMALLICALSLFVGGFINPIWEGLQPLAVLLLAKSFRINKTVSPKKSYTNGVRRLQDGR